MNVGTRVEMPVSDHEWQAGTVERIEADGEAIVVRWDDGHCSTEPSDNLDLLSSQ